MLYLIKTEDRASGADKLTKLKKALLAKKPDAGSFSLDEEDFDIEKLKEFIYSSGLFEKKYIVVLKNLLSETDSRDEVLPFLKEIKESENIFIILETDLPKSIFNRIKKYAEKTEGTEAKKPKTKKKFDIFSLTDSFGARNKKKTWILYRQALSRGKSPEEIHGILFWQLKNLILSRRIKSAEEASLNPFVFSKAKGYTKNFTLSELQELSFSLTDIYHKARRGLINLELGIERFLLKI